MIIISIDRKTEKIISVEKFSSEKDAPMTAMADLIAQWAVDEGTVAKFTNS